VELGEGVAMKLVLVKGIWRITMGKLVVISCVLMLRMMSINPSKGWCLFRKKGKRDQTL
jgi:hypothetical protein